MSDKDISVYAPNPDTIYTTIKTRIINKHDTEEHWNASGVKDTFIPKQGEMVVYDVDSTYAYERVKIGDGSTAVGALPFITDNVVIDTSGLAKLDDPNIFSAANTFKNGLNTTSLNIGEMKEDGVLLNSYVDISVGQQSSSTGYPTSKVQFKSTSMQEYNGLNQFTFLSTGGSEGGANLNLIDWDEDNAIFVGARIRINRSGNISLNKITYDKTSGEQTGVVALQFPSTGGTIAVTDDIPNVADFAKLSSDNAFSGINTFGKHVALTYGPEGYIDFGNDVHFWGNSMRKYVDGTQTYSLHFPTDKTGNHTFAMLDDIPNTNTFATITGNNNFTGNNSFPKINFADSEDNIITVAMPDDLDGGLEYSVTLPSAGGQLATISDIDSKIVANPTAAGTANLARLKVGGTVYTIPSGGSGDVTAAGDNTFTGENSFIKKYDTLAIQNTIQMAASGVLVGSGVIGATPTISVTYGYNTISAKTVSGTYTYSFPSKGGTIAVTDDIPIKSATLDGTTLSITLA